jgi:hypothetical protein
LGSEWGTISTSKFEKFLGFLLSFIPNALLQFVLSSQSSEDLDTDGLLTEDRRGFCLKISKDADGGDEEEEDDGKVETSATDRGQATPAARDSDEESAI